MNKYPKVNYIGNKEKISEWIIECLPIKKGRILDLFCGGCSISYALKQKGFEVITNDILYSNFCISKAIIENSEDKLNLDNINEDNIIQYFDEEIYQNIKWMENKLYFDYEVKELACLVSYSKKLIGNKKYLFLALLRRSMIRKIPYSRMNIKWEEIVKLRDEELSYRKYKRRRAYHNKTFTFHIKDNLDMYNDSIINTGYKNKSYQKDALELLDTMNGKVDLIYMDPPYPSTMNKYEEFYGAFDNMFKKKKSYTDFTDKNIFLINLKLLIMKAKYKTRFVAISLNNKSKPSYEDLIENLSNVVKNITIHKKDHIYKVTGKYNKNDSYEVLIVMEV